MSVSQPPSSSSEVAPVDRANDQCAEAAAATSISPTASVSASFSAAPTEGAPLASTTSSVSSTPPTRRSNLRSSSMKQDRVKQRLAQIEEQETAGLVRMSHGLLYTRASMRQVRRFEDFDLPRLYIPDEAAPNSEAARRALAAFGASLVLAQMPSMDTLTTQSFEAGAFSERMSRAEQNTFLDSLPYDAFDVILFHLDDYSLSMVSKVNHAFCKAARLSAHAREEAVVALQEERLSECTQA